jgi:antitoxin (DNA-binding transcriptional repressor) of toxin-antitoxin stability system
MAYTIHQAKTSLSKLIQEAQEGKEVVIANGKKPVAKIVAIGADVKKRVPGRFEGEGWFAPDAFDPLTEQELKDLGFE